MRINHWTTYRIDDGHGTEICTGVEGVQALLIAQRKADRMGEPVYLSREDGTGDDIEVEPSDWAIE